MERRGVGRASIITAIENKRLTIIVDIVKMKLRSIAPKFKDPNSILVLRRAILTLVLKNFSTSSVNYNRI
jgi:hypothetical protein